MVTGDLAAESAKGWGKEGFDSRLFESCFKKNKLYCTNLPGKGAECNISHLSLGYFPLLLLQVPSKISSR